MHKVIINTFLLIILCIMLLSLFRVLGGRSEEQTNITKLQSVLAQEQSQNTSLKKQYSYYSSNEYVEEVSRDQLGLVKKGETMVVLPTNAPQSITSQGKYSEPGAKSYFSDWMSLLLN